MYNSSLNWGDAMNDNSRSSINEDSNGSQNYLTSLSTNHNTTSILASKEYNYQQIAEESTDGFNLLVKQVSNKQQARQREKKK